MQSSASAVKSKHNHVQVQSRANQVRVQSSASAVKGKHDHVQVQSSASAAKSSAAVQV